MFAQKGSAYQPGKLFKGKKRGMERAMDGEKQALVRFNGVNHLAMITGDMEATIHFWRDLLGMRLVAGLGRPGYRHYFFEISANDLIAFFEWPGVEAIAERDHGTPMQGPVVFDHVSIGVANQDDLWVLKDRLDAAGFWASEVIDHGFINSLYSFDPNGIPIEFSFMVPGADPRALPKMADKKPGPAAMEGPEPAAGRWPEVKDPTSEEDKVVYPGEGSDRLGPRASAGKWAASRR